MMDSLAPSQGFNSCPLASKALALVFKLNDQQAGVGRSKVHQNGVLQDFDAHI